MLHQKLMSFALTGGEWVLWLLIGLSVLCLGIAVERAIFGAINRTPSGALEEALGGYFRGGQVGSLLSALDGLRGAEARVLAAGLRAAEEGGSAAAEEAIAGTLMFERLRMERGLIVLGTTGANAPFVGLFGTVLGIIKAFHELALENAEAASSVMSGISEALIATAIGLAVAIPAVVLYNVFSRRNKEQLARLESLAHLTLSRLKSRPPLSDPAADEQALRVAKGA